MQPLPKEFEEQMKRLLGEAGFFAYLDALNQPYTRALRVNLLLRPDGTPPCPIEGLGAPVPWAKGAYFVEGDARPGLSPLHEGGLFYMQEPSALTAVTALDPQPGERVLDLCAAPGGKSTQIAALMAGRGLLCCNEPIPSRAQILSRNIERMGVRNAVVLSAMPDALAPRFPAFFDRILVDAPCSGEGMFRRQPEARDEWNADAPRRCADRQMEILAQAAKMLRPGGTQPCLESLAARGLPEARVNEQASLPPPDQVGVELPQGVAGQGNGQAKQPRQQLQHPVGPMHIPQLLDSVGPHPCFRASPTRALAPRRSAPSAR